MPLEEKRILVTGATGFIGGRLAERLAVEYRAKVTGAGRDIEKAGWLLGAGVTLQRFEMLESSSFAELFAGQEIVFHLAVASGTSKPEVAQQVNVEAVAELIRAAAKAGVTRFVHVSSMAVYGPPLMEVISEEHSLDTKQSALYGRTKALGEMLAVDAARDAGLELAIIRPGMVYGPRGRSWTINLFKLVRRGVPVIIGDGKGHAQPVYVDNLTDGMILAATRPEAAGEAFNFVDQPLPWQEMFFYYGAMCGRKLRKVPLWAAKGLLPVVKPFIGRTESTDDLLKFYTNRSVYPIDKAKRLLGYRPKICLDEGMKRTEAWLREAGYL
jgi:nucleoside-diphosphate-sugar epimerase